MLVLLLYIDQSHILRPGKDPLSYPADTESAPAFCAIHLLPDDSSVGNHSHPALQTIHSSAEGGHNNSGKSLFSKQKQKPVHTPGFRTPPRIRSYIPGSSPESVQAAAADRYPWSPGSLPRPIGSRPGELAVVPKFARKE